MIRSIFSLVLLVSLAVLSTPAHATGPYSLSDAAGVDYCSTTTCLEKTPFAYSFVDVPAVNENYPPSIRSCACFSQEGARLVRPEMSVVDGFNKLWIVALYDQDQVCSDAVPPHTSPPDEWDTKIRVRRYNPDGTLDTGWSATAEGKILDLPGADLILGITVDPTGSLYVAVLDVSTVFIAKWDSSGNVVSSFGGAGTGHKQMNASDFPSIPGFPEQMINVENGGLVAVTAGGSTHLYIVGRSTDVNPPFTDSGIFVVRMNANGSYDTNFGEFSGANFWKRGDLGITTAHPVGLPAITHNGSKLVVAFAKDGSSNSAVKVIRTVAANVICTSDSTCLDGTVGTGGAVDFATTTIAGAIWSVSDIEIDPTGGVIGMLLSTKLNNGAGPAEFEIYKMDATTEALTTSFSGDGRVILSTVFGGTGDLDSFGTGGRPLIVPVGGNIYVAGTGPGTFGSVVLTYNGWAVKYNSTGVKDSTFGSGGEIHIPGKTLGGVVYDHTVNGFASKAAFATERFAYVDEFGGAPFCGSP